MRNSLLAVLLLLAGCAFMPGGGAWSPPASERPMPPPQAAPRIPVQEQPLASSTGASATSTNVPSQSAVSTGSGGANSVSAGPLSPVTPANPTLLGDYGALPSPPSWQQAYAGSGASPNRALPTVSTGAVTIALLVPLSGSNAALGQALVNAAQLAVFDLSPANFTLIPKDTGDSTAMALRAYQEAVAAGARLVLGPVLARDVAVLQSLVAQTGVPLISFSNDASLASANIFVFGVTPEAQAAAIMAYAARQGGRISALLPTSRYGDLVLAGARRALPDLRVQRYDAATTDFTAGLDRSLQQQPALLLLAEGGQRLRLLAEQLTNLEASLVAGQARATLLGTALWEEAGLGAAPRLVDSLFAAPDPSLRRGFEASYQRSYGTAPPRLASLAYDMTALTIVAAQRDPQLRIATLADPNGFSGVDGVFRLLPGGLVQRQLAVLRITPAGVAIAAPAAGSFAASP